MHAAAEAVSRTDTAKQRLVTARAARRTGPRGRNPRTDTKPLSTQERAFVASFLQWGSVDRARRDAGYKSSATGQAVYQRPRVQSAIAAARAPLERTRLAMSAQVKDLAARIASSAERQAWWSDIMHGRDPYASAELKDRLKASELLSRVQGDFIERREQVGSQDIRIVHTHVVSHVGAIPASAGVVEHRLLGADPVPSTVVEVSESGQKMAPVHRVEPPIGVIEALEVPVTGATVSDNGTTVAELPQSGRPRGPSGLFLASPPNSQAASGAPIETDRGLGHGQTGDAPQARTAKTGQKMAPRHRVDRLGRRLRRPDRDLVLPPGPPVGQHAVTFGRRKAKVAESGESGENG